jgi:ABC-type spermidine/putrescine transport system permease subunit II
MAPMRKLGQATFVAIMILFMIAPILVSASVSFTADRFLTFPPVGFSLQWYEAILDDPSWRGALLDTLIIGLLCTAIATSTGTLSAYGISRIRRPLLRNAVLVVFLAPLVVPYVSFGMSIYPVFAKYRLIGTHLGVALAQAVISIPFVVVTVLSTIRRRDQTLESAARTLGARPFQAFRYVMLPLLMPGIFAGAILAFMTSFDDVIMPIFIGGARVSTVPKAMLDSLAMSSNPSVMAASTIVSSIGLVAFLLGAALRRRRAEPNRND